MQRMSKTDLRPFHLAIPVSDVKVARNFYSNVLGFSEGRSSDTWVDYNFFGHQLVIHEVGNQEEKAHNPVDGKSIPVPHFGVVLTLEDFDAFSKKLIQKQIQFIIEPYTRFEGQPGEQKTMFFEDPSGNALEFKAFASLENLFEK